MTGILDSIFQLSARMTETSLLMMDSAMRTLQSTVGGLSGQEPYRPPTAPPLAGPVHIDAATAEFSERVTRIVRRTPMKAGALLDASREVWGAARKCFSFIDLRQPREWMTLPFQLPLSFGTLLTQQALRALYVAQAVGPARAPGFLGYMTEPFTDQHVYISLQYKEEIERLHRLLQQSPGDASLLLDLGRCYTKCGLYSEAAQQLELAAEDPALRSQALYEGTVAQYRAGNFRQAVQNGAASLALDPSNQRARFWLWLAAQKLGGYPNDVAEPLRMEMKAGYATPTVEFEDVAAQIGLDKTCGGRGTAVFDFDGDGYLDVVISAAQAGCSLYHNNGDGTFTDVTIGSGLDQCVNSFAAAAGDYNNDGLPDLFITRLGFFVGESALFRNNGDGSFTDVTQQAGVQCWGPAFAAAWVDYDCDGYLDLFIPNNLGGLFERKTPNRLFHNNGDGTFTEVSEQAGLRTFTPSFDGAWGDYNNDGYPDLFVSSGLGRSQLFRNNGDGTFTDVSRQAGIDDPLFGSTAFWCDYDNDGWLDLVQFVWSPPDDVIHTMRTGEGPSHGRPMRIYHNNRDGTFTVRDRDIGIDGCWGTMSGNAGDFNNDGCLDLLLGNGSPHMDRTEPPVLLESDPSGKFRNVTFAAGLPFTGKGHGVNMADLAGDGRLCLIVASGGAYPGDLLTTSVFRPKRLAGNYLNVRLVGTESNRDAIGARVMLEAGGRQQHRLVSGGTGFGCLPYEQHFGLGQGTQADSLDIRWPNGLRQRVGNLPINRTLRIVEGKSGWEDVYSGRDKTAALRQPAGQIDPALSQSGAYSP